MRFSSQISYRQSDFQDFRKEEHEKNRIFVEFGINYEDPDDQDASPEIEWMPRGHKMGTNIPQDLIKMIDANMSMVLFDWSITDKDIFYADNLEGVAMDSLRSKDLQPSLRSLNAGEFKTNLGENFEVFAEISFVPK